MSPRQSRPWVKMWRKERGTFAQLPLVARGVFRELVTVLANDEGVIETGTRDHADAVCFALGADLSDRRTVRRVLPLLHAEGCLRLESGRIVFPGYDRSQDGIRQPSDAHAEPESGATGARTGHEPSTTEARPAHEPSASELRPEHELRPKPTQQLNSGSRAFREEESKKRGEREEIDSARSVFRICFSEAYIAKRAIPWNHGADEKSLDLLAFWCVKTAALSRTEVRLVVARLVAGFFNAATSEPYIVERDYALHVLAKSPGKYYDPPKPAAEPTAKGRIIAAIQQAETAAVEALQRGDMAERGAQIAKKQALENELHRAKRGAAA